MNSALAPVLVVDDDLDIVEILSLVLESAGYPVLVAYNGREALELLRGAPKPGLVLLDLMMPVMSGWEFREEQQRDADISGVPVVILSGDGSLREKALSLGVAEYLQKPVDRATLLRLAEKYLVACTGERQWQERRPSLR